MPRDKSGCDVPGGRTRSAEESGRSSGRAERKRERETKWIHADESKREREREGAGFRSQNSRFDGFG